MTLRRKGDAMLLLIVLDNIVIPMRGSGRSGIGGDGRVRWSQKSG